MNVKTNKNLHFCFILIFLCEIGIATATATATATEAASVAAKSTAVENVVKNNDSYNKRIRSKVMNDFDYNSHSQIECDVTLEFHIPHMEGSHDTQKLQLQHNQSIQNKDIPEILNTFSEHYQPWYISIVAFDVNKLTTTSKDSSPNIDTRSTSDSKSEVSIKRWKSNLLENKMNIIYQSGKQTFMFANEIICSTNASSGVIQVQNNSMIISTHSRWNFFVPFQTNSDFFMVTLFQLSSKSIKHSKPNIITRQLVNLFSQNMDESRSSVSKSIELKGRTRLNFQPLTSKDWPQNNQTLKNEKHDEELKQPKDQNFLSMSAHIMVVLSFLSLYFSHYFIVLSKFLFCHLFVSQRYKRRRHDNKENCFQNACKFKHKNNKMNEETMIFLNDPNHNDSINDPQNDDDKENISRGIKENCIPNQYRGKLYDVNSSISRLVQSNQIASSNASESTPFQIVNPPLINRVTDELYYEKSKSLGESTPYQIVNPPLITRMTDKGGSHKSSRIRILNIEENSECNTYVRNDDNTDKEYLKQDILQKGSNRNIENENKSKNNDDYHSAKESRKQVKESTNINTLHFFQHSSIPPIVSTTTKNETFDEMSSPSASTVTTKATANEQNENNNGGIDYQTDFNNKKRGNNADEIQDEMRNKPFIHNKQKEQNNKHKSQQKKADVDDDSFAIQNFEKNSNKLGDNLVSFSKSDEHVENLTKEKYEFNRKGFVGKKLSERHLSVSSCPIPTTFSKTKSNSVAALSESILRQEKRKVFDAAINSKIARRKSNSLLDMREKVYEHSIPQFTLVSPFPCNEEKKTFGSQNSNNEAQSKEKLTSKATQSSFSIQGKVTEHAQNDTHKTPRPLFFNLKKNFDVKQRDSLCTPVKITDLISKKSVHSSPEHKNSERPTKILHTIRSDKRLTASISNCPKEKNSPILTNSSITTNSNLHHGNNKSQADKATQQLQKNEKKTKNIPSNVSNMTQVNQKENENKDSNFLVDVSSIKNNPVKKNISRVQPKRKIIDINDTENESKNKKKRTRLCCIDSFSAKGTQTKVNKRKTEGSSIADQFQTNSQPFIVPTQFPGVKNLTESNTIQLADDDYSFIAFDSINKSKEELNQVKNIIGSMVTFKRSSRHSTKNKREIIKLRKAMKKRKALSSKKKKKIRINRKEQTRMKSYDKKRNNLKNSSKPSKSTEIGEIRIERRRSERIQCLRGKKE